MLWQCKTFCHANKAFGNDILFLFLFFWGGGGGLKVPPHSSSPCVGGCLPKGRRVPHRGHCHTNVEGVIRCQGSVGVKAAKKADTCLSVFPHDLRYQFILTWQGRHHDHEGGSPSARLGHCTPRFADPGEFPKCGNLDCIISGSGGLRPRSPLINCQNQSHHTEQPTVTLIDILWL